MQNDFTCPPNDVGARRIPSPVPSRWRLLGLPVDRVDMEAALAEVGDLVEEARRARLLPSADDDSRALRQIVTLNSEMVMAARRDPRLRDSIQKAALVVPDGVGVVWASRLLGGGLRERVAGVDLIERIGPIVASRGYRLFLLGGRPGIGHEAARRMRARSPGLVIAGVYGGSPQERDFASIHAAIRDADPDLLCVAFGSPAQELWLADHSQQLGAVVAVGIGGALDFIAGAVKRAPRWMRALGLEWLYRLARQPWRWRRMLALPRFVVAVLSEWGRGRDRAQTI